MVTWTKLWRCWVVRVIEHVCVWTHPLHRAPIPVSWFEDHRYRTWRGKVCGLVYGCPLTDVSMDLQDRWGLKDEWVWGEPELDIWHAYWEDEPWVREHSYAIYSVWLRNEYK